MKSHLALATLLVGLALAGCRSHDEHVVDTVPKPPEAAEAPPVAHAAEGARAELGAPAPDFTLKDLDGTPTTLASLRGKIVVLEWFSPDCPFCKYAYTDGPLAEQPERVASSGVVWLSVNSSDPALAAGQVEHNREFYTQHKLRAPLLLDPTGIVGRAYGAKTTPHCYVINEKGVLVYRGALDNAPFGKVQDDKVPKTNYVDAAIADLRSGHAVTTPETRSYG